MNYRALRVEVREPFDMTKVHKKQTSKGGLKERLIWGKCYKGKNNCFLRTKTLRTVADILCTLTFSTTNNLSTSFLTTDLQK